MRNSMHAAQNSVKTVDVKAETIFCKL